MYRLTSIAVFTALALVAFTTPRASAQYTGPIGGGYGMLPSLGNGYNSVYYPAGADLNNSQSIVWDAPDATNADWHNFAGKRVLSRKSEAVVATVDKDGKLVVKWQGDPDDVDRIRVALLDKKGKVISEKTITRLPAEAKLRLTNKTDAYRVAVEYLDGSTTTMTSPL